MGGSNMGAAGNKKPKKDKSGKHVKHIASYLNEKTQPESDDFKKKN